MTRPPDGSEERHKTTGSPVTSDFVIRLLLAPAGDVQLPVTCRRPFACADRVHCIRRCSSVVEHQLPKLNIEVQSFTRFYRIKRSIMDRNAGLLNRASAHLLLILFLTLPDHANHLSRSEQSLQDRELTLLTGLGTSRTLKSQSELGAAVEVERHAYYTLSKYFMDELEDSISE